MPRDTTVSLATLRALARKSCRDSAVTSGGYPHTDGCYVEVRCVDDGVVVAVYGRTRAEAHAMAAAALAARSGR